MVQLSILVIKFTGASPHWTVHFPQTPIQTNWHACLFREDFSLLFIQVITESKPALPSGPFKFSTPVSIHYNWPGMRMVSITEKVQTVQQHKNRQTTYTYTSFVWRNLKSSILLTKCSQHLLVLTRFCSIFRPTISMLNSYLCWFSG